MTEGEKNCGLSSFLPMSCRGRAEAFARRLHSRLRTLGAQDGEDAYASESSWLASNEVTPSVTSLQPRHSQDNELFMDFGIFDTPGSPEEEIPESELTKFITNAKDNLHVPKRHLPEKNCECKENCHQNKRNNSIDSDESDGPYYDPDDSEHLLNNHLNGISSAGSSHHSEDSINHENHACALSADSCLPSSSCTSTLSLESSRNHSFSAEDSTISLSKQESLTEPTLEDDIQQQTPDKGPTSGWNLTYQPQKVSNNNVFSAIDLESLKSKINNYQDIEEFSEEDNSYSSRLELEQNLTVECPEVSETSLEIQDLDEVDDNNLGAIEIETLQVCPKEIDTIPEDPQEEEIDLLPENGLEEGIGEICINESEPDPETEASSKLSPEELSDDHIFGKHQDNHHLRARSAQDFVDDEEEEEEKEERIPRVRRCSSLKTGKTPPGTPGRKKIVRFADVLGLDLADVRTFMDEIPKIPTSAYDDLSDADLTMSCSDQSLSSTGSPLDVHHPKPSKMLMPLFQQPGGEADFLDKVRDNQVCLENAVVLPDLSVQGTVRVRNLDFNKSVHIRYSTDSWRTFADLQATYVDNSCDGFSDKFTFTLYVHNLNIGQKLEFAVRFHCKGCQYWDNNQGVNYCFECLPTGLSIPYTPITLSAHETHHDDHWIGASFYYESIGSDDSNPTYSKSSMA